MENFPQLESGFTPLANALLDAMLLFPFSERQYRVLLTLIRKLDGYRKVRDDISGSQISELCAMSRPHVADVLGQLAAMRVIFKEPGRFGSLIEINRNHSDWLALGVGKTPKQAIMPATHHYTYRITHLATGAFYIGARSCACQPAQDRYIGSGRWAASIKAGELKKEILAVFAQRNDADMAVKATIRAVMDDPLLRNELAGLPTESVQGVPNLNRCTDSVQGVQNLVAASTESVQVDSTDSVHTTENLPTENQQKKKPCASPAMQERFERFYAIYPKKKSRAVAEKAFYKIAPDEQLLASMLQSIERAMTSAQWANPQMIPYPSSWLNAKAWLDDIQTDYSDAERAVIQAFNRVLGEQLGSVDSEAFVESRAGAIRHFLTLSKKPNWVNVYFSYVNTDCEIPPKTGFDWLIKPETFAKVREGHYQTS